MIITPNDIRQVRPLAENINDSKRLVPYIEECEKSVLLPALGAKLYKELQANPKPANFNDIMNGGYYDDDTKYHAGLKEAMGYLVYSRFVRNQNVNATAFGVVVKNGQFSEVADEKTIIRTSNDAEKLGLNYLQQTIDFINFGAEKVAGLKPNRSRFKIIGD